MNVSFLLVSTVPLQLMQLFGRRPRCSTMACATGLANGTILLGIVAALAALGIAALIANLIKFEGGANPRDPKRRRIWYWSILSAVFVAFVSYNQFRILTSISLAWQGLYLKRGVIPGALLLLVVYVGLGFLMSRAMFEKSKLSSWFPRSR